MTSICAQWWNRTNHPNNAPCQLSCRFSKYSNRILTIFTWNVCCYQTNNSPHPQPRNPVCILMYLKSTNESLVFSRAFLQLGGGGFHQHSRASFTPSHSSPNCSLNCCFWVTRDIHGGSRSLHSEREIGKKITFPCTYSNLPWDPAQGFTPTTVINSVWGGLDPSICARIFLGIKAIPTCL